MNSISINGTDYQVQKLLGKGKRGYSCLVKKDGKYFVLKQIHHEPCDYYTFGDKITAEIRDYELLNSAGIRITHKYEVDTANERILKEYIDGSTIFELVRDNVPVDKYFDQVRIMAQNAKANGLNIDYFPTNFVVHNNLLYYIDYECNGYTDEWNFDNWGIKYWSRTQELEDYLKHLAGK